MRSIHEEELRKICAASFMTWCYPNCYVTFSNVVPWEVVLSIQHQNFDFTLKSLIATRRKGFFRDKFLNLIQSYKWTFQICPVIG